ncbi:thiamine pyrophosphate-dependent enzyme [Salisediminibacterium halotolerans]|uniref:2-oxoglutarate ferredoxin oxidoreductase subunit beta n=1 Tax=Salisediminibacterium halotolerans TaxID=517425 RepID=A0A1H9P5Q7_9BACI|nr:thiamine pyrophosphate-dependent enzyme [Salisediminibacterium haloalkalitolerans]SER43528.1 2-oxoglutarate ferredoxin oxidoreductase subunit beta [Salisediminibacterium haloalkalitolerans]
MKPVFTKTAGLTDKPTHYCPGCTHGIIHRLTAEVLEELSLIGQTVGVASVGCSVLAYDYFNSDMTQAAHGRAPAVATGLKRALSDDKIVFTYQGDGDLASIGIGEVIHAAARNENITVIFVNNAIYGMTGGQMAPTTLSGQKTATTPEGRSPESEGSPIRVAEMLATLDGPRYIERVSVHDQKHMLQAKKALKRAFQAQKDLAGFTFVELLSTCPTNWGLSPQDSLNWLSSHLSAAYPPRVFKNTLDREVQ